MTAKQQMHEELLSPNELRQRQADEENQRRQREKLAKQKAAERRKIPVTGAPEEEVTTKRQAPVTKAANSATSATMSAAMARTIRNTNIGDQPPPNVASNARLLLIWENSTEEERQTALLILQLDSKMAATDIEGYFRFGEEWEKLYPRVNCAGGTKDKSRYDCGRETVKKGAILGGTSASRVYQILTTLKAYTQMQYRELAAQAEANGVTIRWTHLRTIAWRLGKSEYRTVRRKVEQELVKQLFTESQLNKRIDELAPATVGNRQHQEDQEEQTAETVTGKSGKTPVAAIVTGLGQVVPQFPRWVKTLNRWESEYQTDSQDEVEATFGTVNTLVHQMQEIRTFLDQAEGILEQMQSTVGFYAKQNDTARRKQEQAERAARINDRVAAERAHAKVQPAKPARLKLTNEFNSVVDDGRPLTYIRDEAEEGDNDEFGPVNGTQQNWDEEEWDNDGDFEDIGEDADDLFSESGDFLEE